MPCLANAIVIHCIDFRFQKFTDEWLNKNMVDYKFDRVSLAGAVFDFYTVLKQVDISNRLHQIKKVILINHEDCGAYGQEGNLVRHKHDLIDAEKKIESLFPHLDVEAYYLTLKGKFKEVSRTKPRFK